MRTVDVGDLDSEGTPQLCQEWQKSAWEMANPISKPWWILIKLVSNLYPADTVVANFNDKLQFFATRFDDLA